MHLEILLNKPINQTYPLYLENMAQKGDDELAKSGRVTLYALCYVIFARTHLIFTLMLENYQPKTGKKTKKLYTLLSLLTC